MAWVIGDRKCPSCGSTHRVVVLQGRGGGFRLSCSWCAFLSAPLSARKAFFEEWTDIEYPDGYIMHLAGIMHWEKGRMVENVPIRVIKNKRSALVTAEKSPSS